MEVCGGQTHSIVRYGIDRMLPPTIELVHGPGLPGLRHLARDDRPRARDRRRPDVIFTSFGDMLRVPGSRGDLLTLRSRGRRRARRLLAARRASASPRATRSRRVVFFAIGFETTAPANAMAVCQAHAGRASATSRCSCRTCSCRRRWRPSSQSPDNRVQALPRSRPRLRRHGLPRVRAALRALPRADRDHRLRAARSARGHPDGGPAARGGPRRGREPVRARRLARRQPRGARRRRRGLRGRATASGAASAPSPKSGYRLRDEYREHDAERLFEVEDIATARVGGRASAARSCAGCKKPADCPAFGRQCTPRAAARRHHGLGRGRLRGVLPVRAPSRRTRGRPAMSLDGAGRAEPFGECPLPVTQTRGDPARPRQRGQADARS